MKAAGHWQGAHMSPIDRKAPDVETPAMSDGRGNSMNRYDYQFGITVNALGQRFFDEGEAKHAYTYAKTGRAVLSQPGGVAWQIYDQTGIDLFRHGRDYPATMVEAPTLARAGAEDRHRAGAVPAHGRGVQRRLPRRTSRSWRASSTANAPSASRRRSRTGQCRSRVARSAPIPITAGITFSFGGVQVDTEARVINTTLQPIEGLFASGDIIGLFFHNYPSCTGQTRNAVFSHLAGRNAAAMLEKN